MSNAQEVTISFESLNAWEDTNKCFELLELHKKYKDVGLMPDRYGTSDRRTFALSDLNEAQIVKYWKKANGGIFKRIHPWHFIIMVFSMKMMPKSKVIPISNLSTWIDKSYFLQDKRRKSQYLELCKDYYAWGEMQHGFIALVEEYEMKNSFGSGRGVGGANLRRGLPGIYWANFFGPKYVEWFGREKFDSIDAYQAERLPDGGWMIISRPEVLTWDEPAIRKREQQIIEQLGRDAFFEMGHPNKTISIPPFLASSS